jgi:hypothetical protein
VIDKYKNNWYDFDAVVAATSLSRRAARELVTAVPASLVRQEDNPGRGRPRNLYHYTALPELQAAHQMRLQSPEPEPQTQTQTPPTGGPAADDLACAELRMQAVLEYMALAKQTDCRSAADDVANAWRRRDRSRTVRSVERIGNHERRAAKKVCIGGFSPKTLRRWAAIYNDARARGADAALMALAPRRKAAVGRRPVEIPLDDLEFVRMTAVSTARADVAKAVEMAKAHLSPQARDVSLATWRRRLNALDPRGGLRDLLHSRSRFRARQTPDVEIDWSRLAYNGRWELDDVQKDWYGYGSEMDRLIRPHGYAIIRVRTRQWIAFAASETPPTQENVRELIGFALCNPFGGIPETIKFERGTVACTPDLQALLESLGIKVSRTSMDGGAALPGMIEDRAKGHFQGKGVVERAFRDSHNREWMERNQVGPAEATTAPARLERIKALAQREAAEGRFLLARQPEEWFGVFARTMDLHNNRPHGALPLIVDPQTGERRNMSPNEQARALGDTPVRVMDERLLPRFIARAEIVPVTRNGIRLNNNTYGRFDEDLQRHKQVTVFASKDFPAVAYVNELGRCLRAYEKAAPGEWDQFEKKRHLEKRFRNQAQALQARFVESGKPGVFDVLMAAGNPTPERLVAGYVCPPEMLAQAEGLRAGVEDYRRDRRLSSERFEPDAAPARADRRGGGLLAREAEMAAHVATLSDPQTSNEEEIW